MQGKPINNEGYAMVLALVFITALALLAGIIVAVSTSEKQTAFNDYTYSRAFYSADAGGEAAINWLLLSTSKPDLLDTLNTVFVPAGYDTLSNDHLYKHNITEVGQAHRAGWGTEWYDFEYEVESEGSSVAQASSDLELHVLRLYREGY